MLVCVLIGWVLFRAEGLSHALSYMYAMIGLYDNPLFGYDTLRVGLEFSFTWVIGIIACIPISKILMARRFAGGTPAVIFSWVYAVLILLLSSILLYSAEKTPFIYFAF